MEFDEEHRVLGARMRCRARMYQPEARGISELIRRSDRSLLGAAERAAQRPESPPYSAGGIRRGYLAATTVTVKEYG